MKSDEADYSKVVDESKIKIKTGKKKTGKKEDAEVSKSAIGCAEGTKRQSVVLTIDLITKLRIEAAVNQRNLSAEIQARLEVSIKSNKNSLGEITN